LFSGEDDVFGRTLAAGSFTILDLPSQGAAENKLAGRICKNAHIIPVKTILAIRQLNNRCSS